MSTPFEISVIVLNYNGADHIRECLSSLANLTPITNYQVRLVCVDNCSSDNSLNLVRYEFPNVEVIAFDKNYGFAEGYNRAINIVQSQYIVLLNNDTRVQTNWLTEMMKGILDHPGVAICGSTIMDYWENSTVEYRGGKFTIIGNGVQPFTGEKINRNLDVCYTGYACGASLLINRDVFLQLNGFDCRYFAYVEDLDLCWRAWLAGFKVLYIPNAIIYHKFGSIGGNRRSPFRLSKVLKN